MNELPPAGEAANDQANQLLTAGVGVGLLGVAGALLGAVCPLCVVVTPALLGAGAVQKLRARWLARQAPPRDPQHPSREP